MDVDCLLGQQGWRVEPLAQGLRPRSGINFVLVSQRFTLMTLPALLEGTGRETWKRTMPRECGSRSLKETLEVR